MKIGSNKKAQFFLGLPNMYKSNYVGQFNGKMRKKKLFLQEKREL